MASMETLITLGTKIMVPIQDCSDSNGYVLESDGDRFLELIPKTVTFWKRAMVIGATKLFSPEYYSIKLNYSIQLGKAVVEVSEETIAAWQKEFYGPNWSIDLRKEHPING